MGRPRYNRAIGVALCCGLGGLGCGSVDPGEDFQYAEVVFDENFFYCNVEPMLFEQGCGSGEADEAGNCHFNVTSFVLRDYEPRVGDSCGDQSSPSAGIPPQAQSNYQAAQRQMRQDPEQAPLFARPTRKASHPRRIFDDDAPPADVIRRWATRFSSQ